MFMRILPSKKCLIDFCLLSVMILLYVILCVQIKIQLSLYFLIFSYISTLKRYSMRLVKFGEIVLDL